MESTLLLEKMSSFSESMVQLFVGEQPQRKKIVCFSFFFFFFFLYSFLFFISRIS